jgi:glycosyltransferase involved in cell wall biosynthesis
MALGLPVVATDVPGTREALRSGETGWAVPYGDPAALADALERLVVDPAERARLGARGRAIVLEEFDERAIAEALHFVYLSRTRARGRARARERKEDHDGVVAVGRPRAAR